MKLSPFAVVILAVLLAIGVWSLVGPLPVTTWFLEVAPALIAGVAIGIAWYGFGFAFSRLVCVLLAAHAVVLMVGGKYTYAANPLFEWIKEALGLARNHYDRLGHFMQGFVPALVVREVLLRASPLKPGKWLFFLVASVCLAASAFYELVEWWVAVGTGDDARTAIDFLGSQGDVWDAQWDMCMCLVGAIASQLVLGRLHERAIAKRLPRNTR
jgi:putative membrane protein